MNELIASWWDGSLHRDQVVFGVRWYWWALAGRTVAGLCLILVALDLAGRERLLKLSAWLSVQAEASTLRRVFNHWRIARSVKFYYDTHFAGMATLDALDRMEADPQYTALTDAMEENFDQIKWKRLIPWAVCLVLVLILSYFLDSTALLISGIIAVNIPTTWAFVGSLLLAPLMPISFVLTQRPPFRAIYWLGAATWLLEAVHLAGGTAA